MIERDYQELKSELGLSHYEGRNWRGFHHHATLCIAAYGFLMLERLRGKKTLPLDYRHLPYPKSSGHAAAGPAQRHVPWSIASLHFDWRARLRRHCHIVRAAIFQASTGVRQAAEWIIYDTVELPKSFIFRPIESLEKSCRGRRTFSKQIQPGFLA